MPYCARYWARALVILVSGIFPGSAGAKLRTIALTGQSAHSGNGETTFASFSLPSVNNSGQVAFFGTLAGPMVTAANDSGVWIASEDFNQVAREGEAVSGPFGFAEFSEIPWLPFGSAPFSDTGEVVFRSYVSNSAGNNTLGAIWAGDAERLRPVAFRGMQAPGVATGKTFYADNALASISKAGRVAVASNLLTFRSLVSDGYWVETDDGLQAVAVVGEDATGMGDGVLFASLPLRISGPRVGPLVNSHGEIAFGATLGGPSVTSQNDESQWIGSPGNLTNLAREPVTIEEIGPSATARLSGPTGVNSDRSVALQGTLSGSGIDGSNSSAHLLAEADALVMVARAGDPAPGVDAGHIFTAFPYESVVGSGGHVAFYGGDVNPANPAARKTGIWAGIPGALQLVVREGDLAPGTTAQFDWLIRNTPAINRFGQVAFRVDLEEPPTLVRSDSIWATDFDGNPLMIARTGESIEVAPGEERTIQSLSLATFHGDDDGRPRSLNDFGQVVFRANFNDGSSGLFLSSLVAHLPGDYNRDGRVDTADYVVWRLSLGQTGSGLAADGNRNNVVGSDDYEVWREFFGRTLLGITQPVSFESGAVPEPALCLPLMIAVATAVCLRRR